jgi:hypothetical protein
MASTAALIQRRLDPADIGIEGGGQGWPSGEILLTSTGTPDARRYLLAIPGAIFQADRLTDFLDRVAPFGCPPPGSLIRAYLLPDSPFPSILLKEHEGAPAGIGDAYLRFLDRSRRHWLGALQGTGPGLCPALAWEAGPVRRFLALDEGWMAADPGVPAVADDYLGRALLLLAQPDLAVAWQTMMSLGGVTKIRKITGREFPVWVDLPAHQPDLLASSLLPRVERLLAGA